MASYYGGKGSLLQVSSIICYINNTHLRYFIFYVNCTIYAVHALHCNKKLKLHCVLFIKILDELSLGKMIELISCSIASLQFKHYIALAIYSLGTIGNDDPMYEVCIPHRIPRAWEQQR